MDHHPEWHLTDKGLTVNVKLTSHFAGNKVTRLDFELAEAMNEAYTRTQSTYNMYPYFTTAQWATIKIAVGSVALGLFVFRIISGPNYEIRN
jgi:hypothetical protein